MSALCPICKKHPILIGLNNCGRLECASPTNFWKRGTVDSRSVFLTDRLVDAFEFVRLGREVLVEEERRLEVLEGDSTAADWDKAIRSVNTARGDYHLARERFVRIFTALVDHVRGRSKEMPPVREDLEVPDERSVANPYRIY